MIVQYHNWDFDIAGRVAYEALSSNPSVTKKQKIPGFLY
jgi:hypothetical protein